MATFWQCSKCGYQMEAEVPPEECPGCHEKCLFTDVGCYTPECGGEGHIDPRLAGRQQGRDQTT
jgi:rubredoxin